MITDKQKRYTFESTRENSRTLREKILILIKENIPVDVEEKKQMLDLIDRSTLGIGTEPVTFHMSDLTNIKIKDFQHFLHCIVEYNKNKVDGDFWVPVLGSKHIFKSYDISEIWNLILYNLNHFIPKALEASAKMSKEIISDREEVKRIPTVREL